MKLVICKLFFNERAIPLMLLKKIIIMSLTRIRGFCNPCK